MPSIVRISDTTFYRAQLIVLVAVAFTLPLFTVFNNALIIVLTGISLVASIMTKRYPVWKDPVVLLAAAPFFIYVIMALVWPGNQWYLIERKFGILIFPLIFTGCLRDLRKADRQVVMGAFVLSMILASAVAVGKGGSLYFSMEDEINSYLLFDKPYFGLYLLFCACIACYLAINVSWKRWWLRVVLLMVGVYMMYFAYIIYAKMALISFLFTVPFVILVWLWREQKIRWLLTIGIGTIVLFAGIVFVNDTLRGVLSNVLHYQKLDMSNGQWKYFLSFNMRFAIWDCCMTIIREGQNWLWGTGAQTQDLLNMCYYTTDELWIRHGLDLTSEIRAKFPFNAHNEFLQVWMDTGLAGLLVLVALAIISVTQAIRLKDYIYLAFIVLFFCCCLTESMFLTHKGVVFYGLFNSLLAFQPENRSTG